MKDFFREQSDANELERLRREHAEQEWRSAVDRLIDEAQKEGKFDNLPGKGKPLRLKKNPYAPDQTLAYELLQNNDFTLPWIADRNEILGVIDRFRAGLQQEWRQSRRSSAVGGQQKWATFLQEQEQVLDELNEKIAALNLRIPVDHLEILKLELERELTRIGASRRLPY